MVDPKVDLEGQGHWSRVRSPAEITSFQVSFYSFTCNMFMDEGQMGLGQRSVDQGQRSCVSLGLLE